MKSDSIAATAIRGIVQSYQDGLDAGYDVQQKKIDAILAAYGRALEDPKVVMPSFLHAAIEAAKGEGPALVDAEIMEVRGSGDTEYRIKGTLEQVFRAIQSFFVNFHPHGYSTRVHAIDMGYGGPDDGLYIARVSRLNSCD